MTWFLSGALICSLIYIGHILRAWKATTELAYIAGWKRAMALRDEWDRNKTVYAISDSMLDRLRQPPNLKNVHLVN
jgi:hypothetical protein